MIFWQEIPYAFVSMVVDQRQLLYPFDDNEILHGKRHQRWRCSSQDDTTISITLNA